MTAILSGIVISITGLLYKAASALPLIALLSLIAGRRGNAAFSLWGGEKLISLALRLSPAIPLYILAAYLGVLLPIHSGVANLWKPLLHDAGMAYSSSLAVSLCGIVALLFARNRVTVAIRRLNGERYAISFIRSPLIFCFLAFFFLFLTFVLINWPFAGLPEGLDMDRAAMAVLRNGLRHYFMAFCPAGAVALLYCMHVFSQDPASEARMKRGIRWCAAWAAAGYLPWSLQNWGITLGLGWRGGLQGAAATAIIAQTLALTAISLAIFCWLCIFIWQYKPKILGWVAFVLLFLKDILPWWARIF